MSTQSITLKNRDSEIIISKNGITGTHLKIVKMLRESVDPPGHYVPDPIRYIADEIKKKFPRFKETSIDYREDEKDLIY